MKTKIYKTLTLVLFAVTYTTTFTLHAQDINQKVDSLLALMTLQEKIGQMTLGSKAEIESLGLVDIQTYFLGSVLGGIRSTPEPNTVENWVASYNIMQEKATTTRLGIPLLYGVDAIHGHNFLYGSVIFPHNIGMGCTRNPELVKECARITALEVRATGLEWTIGPCITVPQNEFWGRTYEGYSESTDLVNTLGKADILGYQSDSLGRNNYLLACAKHFVGDGGTENGIDKGNTILSEERLREIHLPPYISAIEAGVGSIMISYSSWNDDKLHGHKELITDVLKDELGFKGFVISDFNGIEQLNVNYDTAVKTAINAGIDMNMQYDYVQFVEALTQLVNVEQVSLDRIDDAVRRILTIKFKMGVFENHTADLSLEDTVGCDSHRQVAAQAVRESLVLLKNDGILPLSKNQNKVLVVGSKANYIGSMCGGWTITWEGGLGNITPGTTVHDAVKKVVGPENVVFTANYNDIPDADYAIVVVGEKPYVEDDGDIDDASGFVLNSGEVNMIQNIKNKGIPMVVVLLSGRPLDIRDQLDLSNALIAAWLPGTEGGTGIADIIFGNFAPKGKLSHTWPKSFEDVPINISDDNTGKEALFPFGYGLTFPVGVSELTENRSDIRIFPNPFTTSTTIEYRLSQPQTVTITIYNQYGKQVDIIRQDQSQGLQKVVWTPEKLVNGVYYFRLENGEIVANGKVVLVR